MQKIYKIKIAGKEISVVQDSDGKFIIPDFVEELKSNGSALKPANEPICLARKPLSEKTVAENVLKWGTGGLNINGCMVETEENEINARDNKYGSNGNSMFHNNKNLNEGWNGNKGRFPANVIHDGSDEVVSGFPNTKSGLLAKHHKSKGSGGASGFLGESMKRDSFEKDYGNDSGSASRYFFKVDGCNIDFFTYLYKVIKSEIQCGNILESQKVGGIVYGVILAVEQCTQNAEQFMCGNKSMVNFQKDMKFITETLIKQMTELKTCNCLQGMSIEWYMQEQEKTINSLMELNIEDASYVENINYLMNFHCEMLELIKVIVNNVQIKSYGNGGKSTGKDITNIIENTERNSRIIYTPKASKSERDAGCEGLERKEGGMRSETSGQHITRRDGGDPLPVRNNHPTVKPIALMRYLCRLITPPKGIVYDPFIGSGTTGISSGLEGFSFIGSEIEKDSYNIADKRIKFHLAQQKLF